MLIDRLDVLNPDMHARISTIFYFGLEGLGGLEMETDENENVCQLPSSIQSGQRTFRELQGSLDSPDPPWSWMNSLFVWLTVR